jgi:hypothetical protein
MRTMFEHPATIQMIERLAYSFKNVGDALNKWAHRLKTEPATRSGSRTVDLDEIERLIDQRVEQRVKAELDARNGVAKQS